MVVEVASSLIIAKLWKSSINKNVRWTIISVMAASFVRNLIMSIETVYFITPDEVDLCNFFGFVKIFTQFFHYMAGIFLSFGLLILSSSKMCVGCLGSGSLHRMRKFGTIYYPFGVAIPFIETIVLIATGYVAKVNYGCWIYTEDEGKKDKLVTVSMLSQNIYLVAALASSITCSAIAINIWKKTSTNVSDKLKKQQAFFGNNMSSGNVMLIEVNAEINGNSTPRLIPDNSWEKVNNNNNSGKLGVTTMTGNDNIDTESVFDLTNNRSTILQTIASTLMFSVACLVEIISILTSLKPQTEKSDAVNDLSAALEFFYPSFGLLFLLPYIVVYVLTWASVGSSAGTWGLY